MSKRTSTEAGFSLYDEEEVALKRSNSASDSEVPGELPSSPSESLSASMDSNNNSIISGSAAFQGERDEMQDRHIVKDDFRQEVAPVCNMYCARHASPGNDFTTLEKSIKKVFIDSFKNVDEDFLNLARQSLPPLKDGATATILLLFNNVLYSANVGDSRAVLCRRKKDTGAYIALPLTVDHSPMLFEERTRIQKSGGFVRDGRVQGIIEVSRSIGDGSFKSFGVTCVPDVKKVTLTDDDKFVILACDGLWKAFSSQEAINFVVKILESKKESELCSRELWKSLADKLGSEAVSRGCGDNVSVILIYFNKGI